MRLPVLIVALLCLSLCCNGQNFFKERYTDCSDHTPCYGCGEAIFKAGDLTGYFKTKIKQSPHHYSKLSGKIICWLAIDANGSCCIVAVKDEIFNKQIRTDLKKWLNESRWIAPATTGKPNKTVAYLRFNFSDTLISVNQLEDGDADASFPADTAIHIDGPAFTYIEQMPRARFDIQKYLSENLHYPDSALEAGIEGRVIVKFIVNEDGRTSNAVAIRKIGYGCDDEAIKAVLGMPAWEPGRQYGKPVKVYYTLPITYKLSNPEPEGQR